MFDPQKLLDQFMGGQSRGGENVPAKSGSGFSPDMLKGLAGGAAAGGLVSILLGSKGGKKLAGGALKLGGAAVLGGLAYRAWQNYQATKGAQTTVPAEQPMKDITPKVEGTVFLPSAPKERNELSLVLLRAMIAAAKADGHIDAKEQQAIFAKLDELDLDTEAKAFVIDELRKPLDIDAVVKGATSPERAVEIYAASVLAIDPDDPAEQAYLAMLASRLKLDPALKASVETEARKLPVTQG
ncbi:tellurite resistance TerB family protein [Taklimakanibacter deserti]|uniref:tellurite resistance TerB family protein n=1 Tax=Taklimakanibacter deserti TaxID=2267839 RepID=UPI000E65B311